jgi:hypothetical protein
VDPEADPTTRHVKATATEGSRGTDKVLFLNLCPTYMGMLGLQIFSQLHIYCIYLLCLYITVQLKVCF